GPGYTSDTATVTLQPSGVHISSVFNCPNCSSATINTTTGAANTPIYATVARLNSGTLNYETIQELRGGLSISVPVVSTDTVGTGVGAITISPVTIGPGTYSGTTAFDPQNGGTAVVTPTQPAGWTTPNNFRQLTINVSAPALTLNSVTVGKDLQAQLGGSLGEAAPAGGVDVTITSGDPTKVLLANSHTAVGTASIVVHVAANSTS